MDMKQVSGSRKRVLVAVDLSEYSLQWDLLLVGVVTLIVLAVGYRSWRQKGAKLPPGPRNWPVVGALLEMERPFLKTLEKFATEYGPIVHFRLGVQTVVVVSSAEAAEDLLKHRDGELPDRATAMTRSAAKYMGFNGEVFQFANSYDAEYKMLREISVTEFFTTAKMRSYEKLRSQEVAAMVEKVFHAIQISKFDKKAHNARNGEAAPMGIKAIVVAAIRNIMFSLCVGTRFDSLPPKDELRQLPDVLDIFMELSMSFDLVDYFPWLAWWDPHGLVKRMKIFEKRQTRFYEIILERHRRAMKQNRESGISEDAADEGSSRYLVDVLLRAQEEGTELKDSSIMATISSMLSVGIDSTGSQLEWVLLELGRHPRMLQRLQYELDAFVGKERPLQEADLPFMPFLNAVVLETLRLHPVVPYMFPHVNMKPSTLCENLPNPAFASYSTVSSDGGFTIPVKTAVIVNCYGIGRDPEAWKNPLQFNPDRFLANGSSLSSESINANGSFYNLLPFGGGRRVCPGYNLAIVLLLRTVGSLVHAFDFAPHRGRSAKDLSVEEVGDFILRPSPSLYLVPTPRLHSKVYKSNIT